MCAHVHAAQNVRAYRAGDFAGVLEVYADAKPAELAFESAPPAMVPLDQDPAILAAFHESDVIVYEDNGVAGFAATFDGTLRALFVHSRARGRGVGGSLLRAVLAAAAGPLKLNVAKSNAAAQRFYRAHGFLPVGEVQRNYNGAPIEYIQMIK